MERDVYEPIHSTGRRFVKGISRVRQISRVTARRFRNTERILKHRGAPGLNTRCYLRPENVEAAGPSLMDIVDAHVYWQHPAITGRRNTPMVDDPLHSIAVKLTRSTFSNKPFTVSEVNEPFPSDYQAEMIPILAAYGAFQDWDGIFIYTFEPKVSGSWEAAVGDHFDLAEDPVKMAQLPVGALLFLRHDVEAARKTIERTYSTEQINESMRLPESESPYYTPGFLLSLPLEHKGKGNGCIESGCRTEAFFILDRDGADLFWKNVRTKRTKRTKYPLTQARLGESVRHKRPMRHKSPRSELEGEETGRLRH